ncbi:WavE lipopolysaccharide synthesis family protein [Vibrio splendidus]|uniref:WavE lipopolysaccharide synthesis family protein n=1 Tax=Vibrio splendidus TaxID=29497 RepID=UPI000CC5D5E8|nr:WavE lipopolysaccharide synthesis family protein [Vibrio splendidus]PMK60411.1 hypothetical protein BCT96_11340 [Vibrio splendidus]
MENSKKCKDFTLLISGPYHPNIIKQIEYNEVFKNIIISNWEGDPVLMVGHKQVFTKKPSYSTCQKIHNSQNIYLHCLCVLSGLQHVNTKYVIKLRTDELYTTIKNALEWFSENKILTCNVFTRNVSYAPFHISDHIMIADVEVLKKTFQYLKNYLENNAESDKFNLLRDTVPAESKIGFAYMKVKGHELSRIDTLNVEYAYRLMLEEMEIFEVDKLVPIEIKSSVAGVFSCYERFVTN